MARARNLPDAAAILALADEKGRLMLRVTPNARDNAITLPADGADRVIHIRITTTPEDGKANAAVLALLSKALHRPKSALTIIRGHSARNKLVAVA